MKRTRFFAIFFLIFAAFFSLGSLFPRPAHSANVERTAVDQVSAAWDTAQEIGVYAYQTDIVQTTWPLPLLANVGLSSREQRLHVEGQTNLDARELAMTLWSGSGGVLDDADAIQMRVSNRKTYGRVGSGSWQEIDAGNDLASLPGLVAPGNDALGYLAAVKEVTNLGTETRMGLTFTRYGFQVDGPAFAAQMRLKLEDELRRNGRLPLGLRLDVSRVYAGMTGAGEIWLDQAGLPLRQIIHLKFPPDRYNQVEVQITTDFSQWGSEVAATGEPGSGGAGGWTAGLFAKILSPKSKIDWETAAANISLLAAVVWLAALAFLHRKSRFVYAAWVTAMIASMLLTPLLQAQQAHAFFAAQNGSPQNPPPEKEPEPARARFAPHTDPLVATALTPDLTRTAPALAQTSAENPTDSDNDGLTDAVEVRIGTFPQIADSDGDGLNDGTEVLELGIDPRSKDTDGDLISDKTEVNGFKDTNNRPWYLDPTNADSNGDGLADTLECLDLQDIDPVTGNLGTPAGIRCQDSDSDGTPDVFDLDDDDDGVPDSVDAAPTTAMGGGRSNGQITGFADQTFEFQVDNLAAGKPAYVDFQFRPANPDHLWYSLSVLDWPGNDREGQIRRVHDTTFADAYPGSSPQDANGDMRLIPMLEIEIPFQPDGYGGLPSLPHAPAQITTTTPITAWLDTAAAGRYQITVRKADAEGNLLAYVPVNLVREQADNSPVAFTARMVYRPTGAGFGMTQRAHLVWVVQIITDTCRPVPSGQSADEWCSDANNWVTNPPTILHTYSDDWYLTGLAVKEDHGLKAGIVYETAQSPGRSQGYEAGLWWLAYGLDQTFIAGRRDVDIAEIERRFDITSTATITERWGITSTLGVAAFDFPEQSDIAQLPLTYTQQILESEFTSSISPTLLFVREEWFRQVSLEGGGNGIVPYGGKTAGVIASNRLGVNLASAQEQTLAGMNWAPFRYNTAQSAWESYPADEYWREAEARYRAIFTRDPQTDPDGLIQQGQVVLAHLFYLGYVQGVNQIVQVGDVPLAYDWQVQLKEEGVNLARSSGTAVKTIISKIVEVALTKEYKTFAPLVWDASGNLTRTRFEAEVGGGFAGVRQAYRDFKDLSAGRKAGVALGVTAAVAAAGLVIGLEAALGRDAGETLLLISHTVNVALAVYDVVDTAVTTVRAVQTGLTTAMREAEVSLKSAGSIASIVGLIIVAAVEIGIFVYQIISSGVKFLSLAFDEALAAVVANIIVAALLVAIAFIPIVGPLIVAIISLIDAVIALVCELTGANDLESEDPWSWQSIVKNYVCAGITGNLAKLVQWLIYDQTPVVDLEEPDRLQIGNFGVALEHPQDGFVQGNRLQVSAVVTTTLYRSWPDSLLPYPFYIWQFGPTFQKKSNFAYQFATTENDLHDTMETGVITYWPENADGRFTITRNPVSGYIFPFDQTGVNRTVTAYLAEGHAIKTQECFAVPNPWLIPPLIPVCYLRNEKDTLQMDLSSGLKFDIFPATLNGFHTLTSACTTGCSLAWGSFPTQKDADGDGLRSQAAGGNDPNDRAPDADLDGLSDFYELQFGSDPLHADGDGDGLSDYDEMRYETDPNRADSDGDGLLDGEEIVGWEYVYGFDSANQPLITHVTADPLSPDTDGDGVTDKLEQVYGFNPRVVGPANVLNINAQFDDADGIVAPGQTVAYTATIKNELRDRYALGLLEVSSPQNGLTGNLAPQVYTLNPQEEANVAGSLTVASLSQSQPVSVTNTAGAIIANLRAEADGRQLWLHLDENSGATTFRDDSLLGHDATCSGNSCPAAGGEGVYGRALQFDGSNDRISTFFDLSENTYSLAFWFKTTCTNCGLAWTATSGRYLYLNSGGYLCAEAGNQVCSVAAYNDGQWHHVAHTINRAGNEQKLYVDGALAATGTLSLGQLTSPEPVIFGVASGYASFNGWMDEVEIYPRTLTAEEIAARFQQPVFHATFDEPAGDFMDSAFGLRLTCPSGRCPGRVNGVRGGAVSFNQQQHLETTGPQVDLSRGNGRFTLAAWVYPIPTFDSRWHALLGNTAGAPSLWYYGSNSLRVEFGPTGHKCSYQGAILSPNRWQHVVAAFDGSRLQIYINGQWQDTTDCNGITPYPTTTLHIGRASREGWIDFTEVYVDNEGDGIGTAEYQLTLDDNEIWYQEDIDGNHFYQINQTRVVADDNSHNFKLWEIDNRNNDLNISQNFNNTTIDYFQTDYDTDGNGTLYWHSWNQFYNGRLDDLRLYSYALTAADVADLYRSGVRALELRFDEPPGAAAFQDHSGNGVTGVCAPPACPDTGLPGRDNQAARFDGVDDYVAADALTGQIAGDALSFGAWVNPDPAFNKQGSLLAFHTASGQNRNLLFYDPSRQKFAYYDDSTNFVYTGNTYAPGQWYHAMAVIDANDKGTLYVNGLSEATFVTTVRPDGNGRFSIGQEWDGSQTSDFFKGMIDQVTVFNIALSQADIADLIAESPVLNLHLDEPLGVNVFANAANPAQNGTCSGASCPAAGADGWMRQAPVFDGGDDQITLANAPTLQLDEFSIGLWVNPAAQRHNWYHTLLFQDNTNCQIKLTLLPDMRVQATTGGYQQTSQGALLQNQWNHVMFTFTGHQLLLYLNGARAGNTGRYTQTCTGSSSQDTLIGSGDGVYRNFAGQVDELVAYDRALSQRDVKELYDYQVSWFDVSVTHRLTVDAEPPAVQLAFSPAIIAAADGQVIAVQAQDEASGLTVEVQVDGGGWRPAVSAQPLALAGSWVFTASLTTPGPHTIEARATDRVGHVSAVDSVSFVVDAADPLVSLDAAVTQQALPAGQNGQTSPWTVDLSGSVADPAPASGVVSVTVQLLDAAGNGVGGQVPAQVANGRWQVAYPFFARPNGRFQVQLTAVDQVGHQTTNSDEIIGVDGTPPAADITFTEPFTNSNYSELSPLLMAGANPTPLIAGTASDTPLPGGSALTLHFEESGGTAVFRDGSGLRRDAICAPPACPAAASGRWGQGAQFDGVNDALTLPGFTFDAADYTMMAWFQTGQAADQTILAAANSAQQPGILLQTGADGRLHFLHRFPAGSSGGEELVSPAAYGDGRWHHAAAVRNGGDLGVYVDGLLVITGTTRVTATQSLSLTVGSLGGSGPFAGTLDEVMVYGRALSAEQIQTIANPAASGVASLEIRFRHLKDGDGTGLPWLPIPLSQPGAAFTAWSAQLPAGLEGPYQIDLRTTDAFGQQNVQLDVWNGEIDTSPPRVQLQIGRSYHRGNNNLAAYKCVVTDYNLADNGFTCPVVTDPVYQSAAWYTSWFSQTKLYQYVSPHWTWLRDENGPYTASACDLFDNCSTAVPAAPRALANTLAAANAPEIAIWTPTPGEVFAPNTPITITGYATAQNYLSQLTVMINGTAISTTTWSNNITDTVWSTVWTPTAEGWYTLSAAVNDKAGGAANSLVSVVVDVTTPQAAVNTSVINSLNFDDAGFVTISGQASDNVGIGRLELNLNGQGWQDTAVPTATFPLPLYNFTVPIFSGSAQPPSGKIFTIAARVTDLAGQTAVVTGTVWADAVPPQPVTMTLSYDIAGSPQPITPGMTVRDVTTPTLKITWPAASDSGSGILEYRAGWEISPTLTLTESANLALYLAPSSHAQAVAEAQRVYAHLVIADNAGNERMQTIGPVTVDTPLTPDFVGQAGSLAYTGWMASGCTLAGVDRHLNQNAPLTPPQRFYLTWDDANLRLAWTGADWDVDGDLFVYLDTGPGGSDQAFDPYPATQANTTLSLPGVTPAGSPPSAMRADYLVWVQDANTAVLMNFGPVGWITQTVFAADQFRFDRTVADPAAPGRPVGQTDLRLPFSLLGLAPGSPLDALAFAVEEGGLRLWAAMPDGNPLNSSLVTGTAVPDTQTFALSRRFHWDNLGSGVCPTGGYPDSSAQVSLTASPNGAVYRFLADELFPYWTMLLGNRPADASRTLALADQNQPWLGDGQTITYTLAFNNQGTETAVNVRAVLTAALALSLPGGNGQTLFLGDVAPGETAQATFQGVIALPPGCAGNPSDACRWASLAAQVYDDAHPESGPPREWLWADHQVDSQPPQFFGMMQPRYWLAAGQNRLEGFAYDPSGVPTMTLEVQSPAGTSWLACPDSTPVDGRWSCLLDAAGASDGDSYQLRLQAADGFGQSSSLANEPVFDFVVDAAPPTMTLSGPALTGTNWLNSGVLSLNGRAGDNGGLDGVTVCTPNPQGGGQICAPAGMQLDPGQAAVAVDDAPLSPLPLGSGTPCTGTGLLARTFVITDNFTLGQVQLGLTISHTHRADLRVWLASPAGTQVQVLDGPGMAAGSGQNGDLLLYDAAANGLDNAFSDDPGLPLFDRPARPVEPLRAFVGQNVQGSWTLTMCDANLGQDDGVYQQSRLILQPQDAASRGGQWSYQTVLPEGDGVAQAVVVTAVDLVGNRSNPLTLTYLVDTVAPVITVTTAPAAPVWPGAAFTLAGQVSDGGQVRTVRLNIIAPDGSVSANTVTQMNGIWSFTGVNQFFINGDYTIFVEAEDAAGNLGTAGPSVLTVLAEPDRVYLPVVVMN